MVSAACVAVRDPKKSFITKNWFSTAPSSLKVAMNTLEPRPMFSSMRPMAGAMPMRTP